MIIEVDEHHHVLPHLAPQGENGALVLLDSHDDMGAGPLDVGTWLLPAASRGCFGTVLWISAWCTNLPDADFSVSVLPAAWFLQTCLRGYRGQPFDRTAVTVGLFCLLPFVFSRARKDDGLPDYLWVGLVLFFGAFALGIWLELRREKTQA